MSQLDEVKEQIKNSFSRIGQQIQESESYTQLQDSYQNMTPVAQKLTWVSGFVLALFLVLFYPMTLFFSSQTAMESFEQKRDLIRELFRTYRDSSAQSSLLPPPSPENLKMTINAILGRADLLPEQNIGVTESSTEGKLIPSSLVSHVLEVKLAKLNLKQIVDIGYTIIGISDSVKMKDLIISANSLDTRYFDVTYKLYALKVPEVTAEPPPEIEAKPKKGSNSKTEDSTKGLDE